MNDQLDLESYYFGFTATGIFEIDHVMYAIARAGKTFHSTSQWQDELPVGYYSNLEGETPEQWIQNSFNKLAKYVEELKKDTEAKITVMEKINAEEIL